MIDKYSADSQYYTTATAVDNSTNTYFYTPNSTAADNYTEFYTTAATAGDNDSHFYSYGNDDDSGLTTWMIVLIAVACLNVVALVIAITLCICVLPGMHSRRVGVIPQPQGNEGNGIHHIRVKEAWMDTPV